MWSSRLTVTPRCQQTCKAVLFLDVGALLLGVIALRPHISRPSSEDAKIIKLQISIKISNLLQFRQQLTATFHSTKSSLQLRRSVFQVCGCLLKLIHPEVLFKSRSSRHCYRNAATEYCESIVLGIFRQKRTDRHVAQYFKGLQELRLARINQNVCEQEEHALLKSTSRVLQQATLSYEFSFVLHQRVEAGQIALNFTQQNEVF